MPKKKPTATNGAITHKTVTVPMIEVPLPVGNYGISQYITRHVEAQLDYREAIALKHLVAGAYDGKMSASRVVRLLLDKAADQLGLPTDAKSLSEYSGNIQSLTD